MTSFEDLMRIDGIRWTIFNYLSYEWDRWDLFRALVGKYFTFMNTCRFCFREMGFTGCAGYCKRFICATCWNERNSTHHKCRECVQFYLRIEELMNRQPYLKRLKLE